MSDLQPDFMTPAQLAKFDAARRERPSTPLEPGNPKIKQLFDQLEKHPWPRPYESETRAGQLAKWEAFSDHLLGPMWSALAGGGIVPIQQEAINEIVYPADEYYRARKADLERMSDAQYATARGTMTATWTTGKSPCLTTA